jgi:hypothetical protein
VVDGSDVCVCGGGGGGVEWKWCERDGWACVYSVRQERLKADSLLQQHVALEPSFLLVVEVHVAQHLDGHGVSLPPASESVGDECVRQE